MSLREKIKTKEYIQHIQEKYGVDISKIELIQDIIIEETILGIQRELDDLHKTTSDFGEEKRYELTYKKLLYKLNFYDKLLSK